MAAFVDGDIPAPSESMYPPHAYHPSYPTSHSSPQKRPGVNGRDSNHPPPQSPYTPQTPHFSHPWLNNYHNPTPTPTTPFPHSPLVPDSYVQPPHLYRKPHSTTTSTSFRPPSAGPSSSKSHSHRLNANLDVAGPSNANVDLGPLVGTQRGFRTRERGVEGWSGGMEGVEMVPPSESESREMPEVMVSPATPSRDVKGKGKSVTRGKSTEKGKEKAREGGLDGDVEMSDQTGAGNGVSGQPSVESWAIRDYTHLGVFLSSFLFSFSLLISTDLPAHRRRRRSSRSRSGSVSSLMDEDKEGDNGMDASEMPERMPPKMRKGWIRKTVPVVASGKQSVEGLDQGKIKQKEGAVGMDAEMDGASIQSSGAGIPRLTKSFKVRYQQYQRRRRQRAPCPLLRPLTRPPPSHPHLLLRFHPRTSLTPPHIFTHPIDAPPTHFPIPSSHLPAARPIPT